MSLVGIFAVAGRLYWRNWAVFTGLTAAVVLPCGLLQGLAALLVDDPGAAVAALAVVKHLGSAIALGIVVRLGADHHLGRRTTVAEAIAEVRPRVVDLLLTDLVAGGRLLLVAFVPFFLLGLLFAGTTWLAAVVFYLALVLLAGFILLGGCWVAFTVQLVILEGLTRAAAATRSLALLGTEPLKAIGAALPFGLLLAASSIMLLVAEGADGARAVLSIAVGCSLVQAVVAPLTWATAMVLYHDLRLRPGPVTDGQVTFGQG